MSEIDSIEKFSGHIKQLAKSDNLSLFDAVIAYTEQHDNIDIDDVIQLLDNDTKEFIRLSALNANMVPGMKAPKAIF